MAKKLPKSRISTAEAAPISYKRTKEDVERERRYRAEDAMRTLTRADEIKGDSRLMNDVKMLAKEQMAVAKKFAK